jgi:thiol-disulfide isomerase/thioredoxin
VVVALLAAVGCTKQVPAASEPAAPTSQQPQAPGKLAKLAAVKVADLPVYDLAGLKARVVERKAKVTLVAVWATWCAPCIEEMPTLAAFHAKHAPDGLEILGLCVDDRAELGPKIQAVLDQVQVPFDMALLAPGTDEAFFAGLGEAWDGGLPATVVFGADGSKRFYTRKQLSEAVLEAQIVPLLAGP